MIQRRQFIGSLAAFCTMSVPGARIIAAHSDRNLQWQCDVIQTVPHNYGTAAPVVTGVSLQPNGSLIAIVGDDHYVCIYDSSKQAYVAHLGDHTDWVRTTKFSPDGKFLTSAGNDRKLRVWRTTELENKPFVFRHDHAIIDAAYSSDSRKVATVGFDHELRIFDMKSRRIERRLRCECPDNHAVAFSAENSMIAAGGRSGVICIWDVNTGSEINRFQAHKRRIRSIQFTDDDRIVSCGDDQTVKITPADAPRQMQSLPRHSAKLFSTIILKDDLLATAGSDNLIHVWRMSDAAVIGTLKGHTGTITSLDFSANQLASGSYDTQVRIWKYDDNTVVGRQTKLLDQPNLRFK